MHLSLLCELFQISFAKNVHKQRGPECLVIAVAWIVTGTIKCILCMRQCNDVFCVVTEHSKFAHNTANIGDDIWHTAAWFAEKCRHVESFQCCLVNVLRHLFTSRVSHLLLAVKRYTLSICTPKPETNKNKKT